MTDPEKQELKNDIKKDVLSELKAGSTSVQELEEVQTLDNVESLPAARHQGSKSNAKSKCP